MRATEDAGKGPAAELLSFPDTPDRRLRRALRMLDEALAEQRTAVAAFRDNLAALDGAVSGLSGSAMALHGALEGAAAETARAMLAAQELTATAALMDRLVRA